MPMVSVWAAELSQGNATSDDIAPHDTVLLAHIRYRMVFRIFSIVVVFVKFKSISVVFCPVIYGMQRDRKSVV